MNRLLLIFLLCGTAHVVHAQVFRVLPPPPRTLQPGTALQIRLAGVPAEDAEQLNAQSFTVSADGSITLPYIAPVLVSGLTLSQAERAIERNYIAQRIYRHPTIIIQDRPSASGPWRSPKLLDAPGPSYREQTGTLKDASAFLRSSSQ